MDERCRKIMEAVKLLEKEGVDFGLYTSMPSRCTLPSEIFFSIFPSGFEIKETRTEEEHPWMKYRRMTTKPADIGRDTP